jgi:uncharacterized protein YyaL (SSP411 family)
MVSTKELKKENILLSTTKSSNLVEKKNNPVNWIPWSEDAFKLANQENKPIFLSIGHSSCYLSYLMDEECFKK